MRYVCGLMVWLLPLYTWAGKGSIDIMNTAFRFMQDFSAQHSSGKAFEEWSLCGVHSNRDMGQNATDLVILAALWTQGMPFLQLLAWLGPVRRSPWTLVPRGGGMCTWPGGHNTVAQLYFPTNPYVTKVTGYRKKWPAGGRSSFRYLCPVPEQLQSSMIRLTSVNMTLTTAHHNQSLYLCRHRRRMANMTICPQAMYQLRAMHSLYPDILPEWIAHHHTLGKPRILIYEMFGDVLQPMLQPFISAGMVEYHAAFARGRLKGPAINHCWALDELKHDHCLFTSALRSRWVFLSNAPDAFLWVGPGFTGLHEVLDQSPGHHVAYIQQLQCGARRVANGTSTPLLLSFNGECETRSLLNYVVCDPRAVYNSHIHVPLAVHPPHKFRFFLDTSVAATRHFMNCYKARHAFEPPLQDSDWNVVAHAALTAVLRSLNWSRAALPAAERLNCAPAYYGEKKNMALEK